MTIRIDSIHIRKQGPLRQDMDLDLGDLTLIYGRNERGKTMIVEFLLRSLFKSASGWDLRGMQLEGSVSVSGLPEKLNFYPSSLPKLDDFLAAGPAGLPYDISRLLVVKGADLAFPGGDRGHIQRKFLKEYLSGTGILDSVQQRISSTLQEAKLVGTEIVGPKRGELKRINQMEIELKRMDELLSNFDRHFSWILHLQFQERIRLLGEEKLLLLQAKRYKAFQLHGNIQEKLHDLKLYPEQTILDLHSRIEDYFNLKSTLQDDEDTASSLETDVDKTRWLRSAISQLESSDHAQLVRPHPLILPSAAVALAASIILLLLNIPLGALGSILIAAFLSILYIIRLQKSALSAVQSDQYVRIHREFSERFPEAKGHIASMKAELDRVQPNFYQHEQLQNQIARHRQGLIELQHRIQKDFRSLHHEIAEPTCWRKQLQNIQQERADISRNLRSLELELASLDIPPDQISPENPGEIFSRARWDAVHMELDALQSESIHADEQLHSLKQRFCQQTGNDISDPWEDILQHFKEQRKQALLEYQTELAGAAGRVILQGVIEKLRIQEDDKIESALQSSTLRSPLRRITQTYDHINLENDTLILSGPHNRFALSDLSTGAQEQVLLALRLGLASRVLSGRQAFFILDDAFQHADWQRRERLIKEISSAVDNGWQVIYFTMDDHIRRLFNTLGKKAFKENYISFDLSDS